MTQQICSSDPDFGPAVGLGEIMGLPRRRGQQAQPPRPVTLGTEFVAAQQITLGQDADEVPRLVDDEHAGDLAGQHQVDRFLHRRVRGDGDAIAGHDVGDDHWDSPLWFRS